VSYKINLRFRRFGYGTDHLTGLNTGYIPPRPQDAPRGSSVSRAHDLAIIGSKPGPATISPCTVTMDLDEIICFMTDRLARGPDQDVHVPSVGSTKVPFSWCRCHLLAVDYRWGTMGPDETAMATTGCPRVIPYFTGTGCYRVQIIYFFRMQIGSRTRSGIGLGSGGRRHRMRRCLGLSRELWIENFGDLGWRQMRG